LLKKVFLLLACVLISIGVGSILGNDLAVPNAFIGCVLVLIYLDMGKIGK
jgi:putative effector of murein hydrolase LrgA (UPF0299 family)